VRNETTKDLQIYIFVNIVPSPISERLIEISTSLMSSVIPYCLSLSLSLSLITRSVPF